MPIWIHKAKCNRYTQLHDAHTREKDPSHCCELIFTQCTQLLRENKKRWDRNCVGVIACENREYSSEMCLNGLISIDFVIDCIPIAISKVPAVRPMRDNKNNNVNKTYSPNVHSRLYISLSFPLCRHSIDNILDCFAFFGKSIVRMTNESIHKMCKQFFTDTSVQFALIYNLQFSNRMEWKVFPVNSLIASASWLCIDNFLVVSIVRSITIVSLIGPIFRGWNAVERFEGC